MSPWPKLARGLRVLFRRSAADSEVSEEVQQYLEQSTAAFMARGLPPEEALRAARMEMGSATAVREEIRAQGWEDAIATLLGDLRHGLRLLRKSPGFTAVSVLILALGIGSSTAIFSAVNPILFESLPYPDAGRVAMISPRREDGAKAGGIAFGNVRELAQRQEAFQALAAFRLWQPTLTGPLEPERLEGQRVGGGYFRALGVRPALGTDFDPVEDRPKGANLAILSDGLWRRRFAADRGIVGRLVTLDDDSFQVVGVMPPGFENVLAPSAQIWTLLQYDESHLGDTTTREWGNHLRLVGRLRPGVSMERARGDLDAIARKPIAAFARPPWAAVEYGFVVRSLQDEVTESVRPALLAVLGAVIVLLLIACVNVTNLVLARGAQRRGEIALRAALGASRWRVVRQLLTESIVLAILGGAAGMALAAWGVQALVALSPHHLPRLAAIRLDGRALAFALGVTLVVGLVFGSIPAFHGSRGDLRAALQQSSGRTAGGHQTTRRALVVAEVALALVLLVGAGLLLRSLRRLFSVDPGFDSRGVLTLQVQTAGRHFPDDAARHRFFAEALEAVRHVPSVVSAGFTCQLPLSGDADGYGVSLESEVGEAQAAFRYAVRGDYFQTMGIPLRAGRLFDDRDAQGPMVVVINESFAKRKFPGVDPIGKRLRFGPSAELRTIVGVVADVRQLSLSDSEPDAVYLPARQWPWADRVQTLVVRSHVEAPALVAGIRKAIWSVDKDQPIARIATMEDLLAASASERRFALVLFEAFGAVALLLAAMGIYGVLSGSVAERTREIGIRSALGASPGGILSLIVRQGFALTALGAAIGLTAAIAASQALAGLLFGVSRLDPLTYLAMVALLLLVSLVACWMPAWRAARVDPAIALRVE
jgi:putative ABC transport system permease protein